MTAEKEYFIYLISCFLSGKTPEGRQVDWNEIFRLADINDVGAVIAYEVKQLPDEFSPSGELKSKFNQLIGFAVRDYEIKCKTIEAVNTMLSENKIEHIFVKGAVIKELYPVKELRTSGDIDVIVREERFQGIFDLIKSSDIIERYLISDINYNHYAISFRIHGILVELHRDADVLNEYFNNIFELAEKKSEYEYSLNEVDHLIYIFLHLIKHLSSRGAGIRMLMDMDVVIRKINNFDECDFYKKCEAAGKIKTAEIILSYLNYCFNTPVNDLVVIADNKELIEKLSYAFIDGGSFGYEKETLGLFHFHYNNTDGKVNLVTKLKTILRYVFPPIDYIREYREYSLKHSALIPLAYIARIKDAVFKRGKHSKNTFKEIINIKQEDLEQKKLLNELDFDNE